MGLSAGETNPPNLLPSAGRKLSVRIFNDRNVFAITRQSAPASSAARAIETMSPALGESLTHSGLVVAARMAPTAFLAWSSCIAKLPPVALRVGQEIFASIT